MLAFPDSPILGQTVTGAGKTYAWDGEKWTTHSTSPLTSAPPSTTNPQMDSVSHTGSSGRYARGDHIHPSDTSRLAKNNSSFTGTLTASFLSVVSISITGKFTSAVKGHRFGTAGGTAADGAVVQADANILLYNHSAPGGGSWCGMGADSSGHVWVRTGYSGSPIPVFHVRNDQITLFRNPFTLNTPGAEDNSTRVATTAFVKARAPAGGSFLPLAGGTINGSLTLNGGDLRTYRSDGMGVIWFGNANQGYIHWNNSQYYLLNGHAYSAAGRLWGSSDFGVPYNNARLAYVGDPTHAYASGMSEPYGGSAATGQNGARVSSGWIVRYRQFQYYTTSWFAIAYA